MSLRDFFSGLFKAKETDKKSAGKGFPPLTEQIVHSMDLLVQKTDSLNDTYEVEKTALKRIFASVQTFVTVDDIASAKYEQEILGRITKVSSACDAAIVGKPGADIASAIGDLQSAVTSRLGMQGPKRV